MGEQPDFGVADELDHDTGTGLACMVERQALDVYRPHAY